MTYKYFQFQYPSLLLLQDTASSTDICPVFHFSPSAKFICALVASRLLADCCIRVFQLCMSTGVVSQMFTSSECPLL